MKTYSIKLNFISKFLISFAILSTFQREALAIRGDRSSLTHSTKSPDYSDLYDKIDENDIFKNIRHIMRNGDPANNVPRMVPFTRSQEHYGNNDLGDREDQTIEGLDQFITKSSLIFSNNQKFDFSLFWPKITFASTHTSSRSYRVFYSNYTFTGCTIRGEADILKTSTDGCHQLKDLRLTLHFKSYTVNVVTPSTEEGDKEIANTARATLDRYIKQEYVLGLERTAYELEKNIKEYFGNYRCLIKEEVNTRPPRKNNQNTNNNQGYGSSSNSNPNNRGVQTDFVFDGPTARSSQTNRANSFQNNGANSFQNNGAGSQSNGAGSLQNNRAVTQNYNVHRTQDGFYK